jgi:hypothetical protein
LVLHKVDGILSGNFNYVVVDPRRSTAWVLYSSSQP